MGRSLIRGHFVDVVDAAKAGFLGLGCVQRVPTVKDAIPHRLKGIDILGNDDERSDSTRGCVSSNAYVCEAPLPVLAPLSRRQSIEAHFAPFRSSRTGGRFTASACATVCRTSVDAEFV